MPLYALDGIAPDIAPDAYVAPTAVLIGRVRLKAGASVWWNAVLRGDNEWIEVGEGSNIQDGAICHTDPGAPLVIEQSVTVGHAAILHGCLIAKGALVGMGATVLNHARIGQEALVGARALVAERKEIESRSLAIGAPAKVVRTLTDEEVAAMRGGTERYVENGARYAAGCIALP